MGNAISPCLKGNSRASSVKLIFWEGTTTILTGKHLAGEIMFQHPDKMVCHADSFFIGRPIPSLSIDDELLAGQTYFVLHIDRFACDVLSTSSLAAAVAAANNSPNSKPAVKFADQGPFEYVKGANGRVLIKVAPAFIGGLICKRDEMAAAGSPENGSSLLCSTPELQKDYDQLVGSAKGQVWSPKLETIAEYKIRYSPCRVIGFKVKQKEG